MADLLEEKAEDVVEANQKDLIKASASGKSRQSLSLATHSPKLSAMFVCVGEEAGKN